MISLSALVKADFESHFSENEKQDIRIYLAPGAISSRLALVLDTAQKEDEVYEVDGYRFCFSKGLLEKCGGIDIDLNDMGFVVEPRIAFAKKTVSCASNCSTCSSTCESKRVDFS